MSSHDGIQQKLPPYTKRLAQIFNTALALLRDNGGQLPLLCHLDVLDLYAEEADPRRPVVCFDESPTQLIGELRERITGASGQPER